MQWDSRFLTRFLDTKLNLTKLNNGDFQNYWREKYVLKKDGWVQNKNTKEWVHNLYFSF